MKSDKIKYSYFKFLRHSSVRATKTDKATDIDVNAELVMRMK